MPLATRPNQRYEVVLSTDMELPEADRPVFVFRYINIIEWEAIAALNDKFESTEDAKEMIKLAFQVIEKTLCDWRNMKTPEGQEIKFNFMMLKSMVSLQEVTELMMAAVAQRPGIEDKKKLSSPSALSTEPASIPAKSAASPKSADIEKDEQK